MGTSSDRDGGRGGAWSPLKTAATNFAKSAGGGGGTDTQIRRLLARHVSVFGGASAAAGTAASGSAAIGALGGFLADVAEGGIERALRRVGLDHLIGADRFDVLDELITLLTSDGADLESQAARDAQCDVLDEFLGDTESWDDLSQLQVTGPMLATMLRDFLARYVYNRIPAIGERLARILDPAAMKRANARIIAMIRDLVDLQMPADPIRFDWSGPAGREFSDGAVADIYTVLDALGDEDL